MPADHVEADLRLGSWVSCRRSDDKAGRLDPARAAELEGLPGWTWDPWADDWAAGLAALRAFIAREGDARVPRSHVEGELRLGEWMKTRRAERRAGRLDPARREELEALPGWTWDRFADEWEEGIVALRAFAAREGHARVTRGHVEGDLRLGAWVNSRRAEQRRGKLDPARSAELETIPGWNWRPRSKT